MINEKTLVLMYSPKDKLSFFIQLTKDTDFSTHHGIIKHNNILDKNYEDVVYTHKEIPFYIFRPSLFDIMMHVKRHTQIIYPKDVGYILLKLGVRHSDKILEAGTGSGALSIALAYSIFPDGHLYTYERREEFAKKAYKNIQMAGVENLVTSKVKDIGTEGFDETSADAVFLDMKEPSLAIEKSYDALRHGGMLGILVPTTNQITACIETIESLPFTHIEVTEILIRHYKVNKDRLRPQDRMIGHTGYLIFCKKNYQLES